jgi:hypothetical protein
MLGVAADAIRWICIALCTVVYLAIVYLASLDFRVGQGTVLPSGVLNWVLSIVRHVVLIPGLLPLIAVIVWLRRARSWQGLVIGAALVACVLFYHYVLFAISAHSDAAYPWFQVGEFVLLWFVLKYLLRLRGASA